MFSLMDWLRLFMAALFILPLVTVIRESGYYIAATLLGGTNKKLIVGSGPTLFKWHTLEVRRYFFMYSWMEYDELRPSTKFWHAFIYISPILTTSFCAILVNWLILQGTLSDNIFWTTFVFYCFYFVLFDVIPVYLPDGQPTNGRAIFDLIWHGERSDYKKMREEKTVNEPKSEEERSNTDAQEETMENRDRDDEERKDHTDTSYPQNTANQRSYTEKQEKTKQNRDRDEKERKDHTEPN
ncbi:hypothetical protein [Alkalicoccobacillus porphyridii]|uniref:hypothetical protein n=1 Tax=Alkalicoccobacillus porphyridii TaxID=2597270 RepID=UPI00163DAAD5|nr:hypothetical protein [Alkalicoccobacillus porphyridii]